MTSRDLTKKSSCWKIVHRTFGYWWCEKTLPKFVLGRSLTMQMENVREADWKTEKMEHNCEAMEISHPIILRTQFLYGFFRAIWMSWKHLLAVLVNLPGDVLDLAHAFEPDLQPGERHYGRDQSQRQRVQLDIVADEAVDEKAHRQAQAVEEGGLRERRLPVVGVQTGQQGCKIKAISGNEKQS